jgi:hypothetical protein
MTGRGPRGEGQQRAPFSLDGEERHTGKKRGVDCSLDRGQPRTPAHALRSTKQKANAPPPLPPLRLRPFHFSRLDRGAGVLIVHVVAQKISVDALVALRHEVERPHGGEGAGHHAAERGIVDAEREPGAITVQAVVDQRKGGRGGQEGRGGGRGEGDLLGGQRQSRRLIGFRRENRAYTCLFRDESSRPFAPL